jgi:hypothetical protein
MAKLVRKLADALRAVCNLHIGCQHGGMTEFEEAELTTRQGRALSGHQTDRANGGYAIWGDTAKFTQDRALAAPASATRTGWRTRGAQRGAECVSE